MRLLVIVSHPDDEAFGLGSLLAHASTRGVESVVACATRGELGEPAPASGLPEDVPPDELGRVREAELRAACDLLGVQRVEVLDWLDPGMDGVPAPGSLAAADPDDVARQIAKLVDDVRPDGSPRARQFRASMTAACENALDVQNSARASSLSSRSPSRSTVASW